MARFTDEQIALLTQPIDPDRVGKDGKGHAHLENWDVQRWLNRIFGFGGWSTCVVAVELVAQTSAETTSKAGRPYTAHWVIYRAVVRLELMNPAGELVCVYEDGATGAAEKQPSLADAHDLALKTAISQAEKRAARKLGDQFGLSLYSEGVRRALRDGEPVPAVVGRDAAHNVTAVGPVHDRVDTVSEDVAEPERPAEPVSAPADRPVPPAEQPPAGPPADQATQQQAPTKSPEQRTREFIQIFFNGLEYDRDARLRAVSILAGRPTLIDSTNDLTAPELKAVAERVKAFRRAPNPAMAVSQFVANAIRQRQEQQAAEQAQQQAPAEPPAQSVTDQAADAITTADSIQRLNQIGQQIRKDVQAGRISPEDAAILRQGWDARAAELRNAGQVAA